MSSRLKAPEDGIVASQHPRGWAARRWMGTFDHLAATHHTQLARGRTLARSGRVRDLWFSPGLASAEVVTQRETFRVTLRMRTFEDDEWDRVVERLLADLRRIAALLEAELPETLVADLAEAGVSPLPAYEDLDGICECADFHMPCSHMAAVHHVVAEALDGDPFLLLTLRGLDREQLLARLRRSWGDPLPLHPQAPPTETPPPPADPDWRRSPTPLPSLTLRVEPAERGVGGLRALGPPPGQAELAPVLEPLYDAGSRAAAELAFDESPVDPGIAPASRWEGFRPGQRPPGRPGTPGPAPSRTAGPTADPTEAERPLSERVVDLLAERDNITSTALAKQLGTTSERLREELCALEELGVVYRTGRTRATRWWLG
jgi:uncharacterized Zn finger protein